MKNKIRKNVITGTPLTLFIEYKEKKVQNKEIRTNFGTEKD
ncbi:MAG: hypothetical protein ACP5OE_04885 [Thermodesulfobium sp.]